MEKEKICFKCGESKPLSAFYKHPRMSDGRVNKCKSCNKEDVKDNRAKRVEYYRSYDRDRGSRKPYSQTVEYREKYPNKYKAHCMTNNQIRAGNLSKEPCEVCGSEEYIHAHHDDYMKPLNVRWLCAAHHSQWHKEHGEAKNP